MSIRRRLGFLTDFLSCISLNQIFSEYRTLAHHRLHFSNHKLLFPLLDLRYFAWCDFFVDSVWTLQILRVLTIIEPENPPSINQQRMSRQIITCLILQSHTKSFGCLRCKSTNPLQAYYKLPCGHVFDQTCVKRLLRDRSCVCDRDWGSPLPWFYESPFYEEFDLKCLRFAARVVGGLDLLHRARVNALERLSGTHEALQMPSGAVLCKDACIWPLMAMGRLVPQYHQFSTPVKMQWIIIFLSILDILGAELQAMQASVVELRVRVRFAIYAQICKLWIDGIGFVVPFTYDVNTLRHHVGGRAGHDADLLWRFLNPDDTELGGCLTLLIDSLIEAGPHCQYKAREYMEIGGVKQASCSICLEVDQEAVSLPCGHCFDRDCLVKWFNPQSLGDGRRTWSNLSHSIRRLAG
ncbi:hypothetical protein MRB53_037786 [Persea americana]|nr:hypothetical protein MRB53_037786 [Persea americana]